VTSWLGQGSEKDGRRHRLGLNAYDVLRWCHEKGGRVKREEWSCLVWFWLAEEEEGVSDGFVEV